MVMNVGEKRALETANQHSLVYNSVTLGNLPNFLNLVASAAKGGANNFCPNVSVRIICMRNSQLIIASVYCVLWNARHFSKYLKCIYLSKSLTEIV